MFTRVLSGSGDRQRFSSTHQGRRVVRVGHRLGVWSSLLVCVLRRTLTAVAFWVAVAVPFLSLALLISGLSTPGERVAFVALLAVNAVAFGVGHTHRYPEADPDDSRC